MPPPPGSRGPPLPRTSQRARAISPPRPSPPHAAGRSARRRNRRSPSPQPDDTVVTEMPTQKIANGRAVFSGLDKITGRIISFDAAIGETVQFGALQVTARVCYTRPPTEATNTDAFIEVDEVTLQGEIKRIFTGWIFAASPGLHAVEHPDLRCLADRLRVAIADAGCRAGRSARACGSPPVRARRARPARQAVPRPPQAPPIAPAPPAAAAAALRTAALGGVTSP